MVKNNWAYKEQGTGRTSRNNRTTKKKNRIMKQARLWHFLELFKFLNFNLWQNTHNIKLITLTILKYKLVFSCQVLSDSFLTPWDCSPPGFSVYGISQARILFLLSFSIYCVLLLARPCLPHLFFFLDLLHNLWDLSSPATGMEPVPPAIEACSPNHWTTREFPPHFAFFRLCHTACRILVP